MQYVVHTLGSCGIAVVQFLKRQQKLVKIAREYTVPYRDRMFVTSVKKTCKNVVHTLGFCGSAVVKFKKRRQKLVEIAREYTVPYRDRLFVPSVKTNHVICCAYIGVLWYRGS